MKCPKCAYLGFETSDRCRNCGYDFSLSVHVETPTELPLQERQGAGVPLADFDLTEGTRSTEPASNLDLDRLIGTDTPDRERLAPLSAGASAAVATPPVARAAPRVALQSTEEAAAGTGLPLFSPPADDASDETALITAPRPVRPPLSVRRATPDVPRVRTRTPRPRRDESKLDLDLETPSMDVPAATIGLAEATVERPASRVARLFAMVVDMLLLGGIDAAVVYLTLAIAGLTLADIGVLPPVPMVAFLLLLNGGYLVAFTAACGQTIGKMLTRIRVVTDEGGRVDLGHAVVRAGGCLLSLLTAGLGYLPALVTADARTLQDRVAATRVVSVR